MAYLAIRGKSALKKNCLILQDQYKLQKHTPL